MEIQGKIGMSLFLGILLVGLVSAVQVCQTYDNFSSGVLDNSKFTELPGSDLNNDLTDEHLVQNGVYHTAQLTEADKRTLLLLLKNFSVGDMLEYDVNYVNGSGNRESSVKIDDSVYSILAFWNSIEDAGVGNDFGLYHVKINFTEQGLTDEITLPNGTLVFTRPDGILPSLGLNHTFGVITRTGSNGIVNMDYDNFVICTEQEQNQDIEQRLTDLENRVNNLENHVSVLESLVNRIKRYFNFMPLNIKKDILCDALENSNQTHIEEFGLTCDLKQSKNRNICVCKR